jgi:hypothetical protein
MKSLAFFFSVVALLAGLYYAFASTTVQIMTGEHAATLACAAFLFVIALGVWNRSDN